MTASEITNLEDINIRNLSYHIVNCILNGACIFACQKKKPGLSEKNIANRKDWALKHQHMKFEDFKQIVYTDECRVIVEHSSISFVRKYDEEDSSDNPDFYGATEKFD